MIESTSSCTNASGSKPNFFTANGTIAAGTARPACRVLGQPRFQPAGDARRLGHAADPGGSSITRLLSVMANWPSRKKPSRGVVAIQLGLPRPALRKADCVVFDVFLASLISRP